MRHTVICYNHDLPIFFLAEVVVHAVSFHMAGDKIKTALLVLVDEGTLPVVLLMIDTHLKIKGSEPVLLAGIFEHRSNELRDCLFFKVDVRMPRAGNPGDFGFKDSAVKISVIRGIYIRKFAYNAMIP